MNVSAYQPMRVSGSAGASNEPLTASPGTSATSASGWSGNEAGRSSRISPQSVCVVGISVPTGPGPFDWPPGTGVRDGAVAVEGSGDAAADGVTTTAVGAAETVALPQPTRNAPATTATT